MPAWGKGPNDKPKWLTEDEKAKTTLTTRGWEFEHKNGNKELLVAMYVNLGPQPAALVNTVAPALSGLTPIGSVLTTTNGTWTGEGSITYARVWKRDGVAIAGQTGLTYTTVAGDAGKAITVTVTATDSAAQTDSVTSNSITVDAE